MEGGWRQSGAAAGKRVGPKRHLRASRAEPPPRRRRQGDSSPAGQRCIACCCVHRCRLGCREGRKQEAVASRGRGCKWPQTACRLQDCVNIATALCKGKHWAAWPTRAALTAATATSSSRRASAPARMAPVLTTKPSCDWAGLKVHISAKQWSGSFESSQLPSQKLKRKLLQVQIPCEAFSRRN